MVQSAGGADGPPLPKQSRRRIPPVRWPPRRAGPGAARALAPTMGAMPVPLTGSQYEISAGDYAAIVTELGAGLRALRHRGASLLAGYEPDQVPPAGAGQLLAPW